MKASNILLLSTVTPFTVAETLVGVYVFHRHGDRTPKSLAPTNLTALGYSQVYEAGTYFRNRYVDSVASSRIAGINADTVKLSQLQVSAPVDNVLMNSAQAFTQALYPALGEEISSQRLRNGTTVRAPLNGYQLIPITEASSGTGAEDSGWLQDASNCGAAKDSSNAYFSSSEYQKTYDDNKDFYERLAPVLNSTFNSTEITYENAYTIFDYINVARIHNASIPSSSLLSPSTLQTLQTLAATHELNLAYNATSPVRAIAGSVLAAEAVDFLKSTIATSKPKLRLGVQFGAYATFQSYFGLAGLLDVPGAPNSSSDGESITFQGIPDYASAMVWELFVDSDETPTYPIDPSDLSVRFLFRNGTENGGLNAYPLFGSESNTMSWDDFVEGSGKFSVGSTRDWCIACGNSTGSCAEFAGDVAGASSSSATNGRKGSSGNQNISNAVAGVIGAVVALAVVLAVEALVLLVAGLRLVSKKRMAQGRAVANGQGLEKKGRGRAGYTGSSASGSIDDEEKGA